MLSSWEYGGEFLNRYPQNTRSTISNLFCYAVRDGMKTVFQIVSQVEYLVHRRIRPDNVSFLTNEWLEVLIEHLNDQEAQDFAAFILERESLTPDEKEKLKQKSGQTYQQDYMAAQSPTEKQVKYLKSLGCSTEPQSRLEASRLIDECLKRKAA